jgi:hypothetical protein
MDEHVCTDVSVEDGHASLPPKQQHWLPRLPVSSQAGRCVREEKLVQSKPVVGWGVAGV